MVENAIAMAIKTPNWKKNVILLPNRKTDAPKVVNAPPTTLIPISVRACLRAHIQMLE